jgi:NAD(P)-dependent dehydrogenase (short-subunit alcohol dehydrogenase family)
MEELKGKVAFVTGAASGIGLALAKRFATEGMKVVLADIEADALEKAEAEVASSGAETLAVECDVSSAESVVAAEERAIEVFGAVHVLCNNAGVSPIGDLDTSTADDWEWGIGVNLMGVVHGIQAFVPGMKQRGQGGHVVNTASLAGIVPLPSLGVYTASKYAVVGISEILNLELAAHGIGVSVLCPSFVNTSLPSSTRNRPPGMGETAEFPEFLATALKGAMDPADVADHVVKAIRAGNLYIMTHADAKPAFEARSQAMLAAFDE